MKAIIEYNSRKIAIDVAKSIGVSEVVTVAPEVMKIHFVISKKKIQTPIRNKKRGAIVIRRLPNLSSYQMPL
jgi:hypothetical protein